MKGRGIRVAYILPTVPRFKSDKKKLDWLNAEAAASSRDPRIVAKASELVHDLAPDNWAGMAERIHAFVRDRIRYQHDPNHIEALDPTPVVLERGWDDCDGKARLAAALAQAVGLSAKVWPMWRGPMLAHVQTAFRWPGSEKYPGAKPDGTVIGEVTIKGVRLGQDPREIERNPETGRLPLS